MRYEGKVAVVTGAAQGIGAATAEKLASEGAAVYLGDVDEDLGVEAAERIGSAAHFRHCDVTVENDIAALIHLAASEQGRLDLLFNNAGNSEPRAPIDEVEQADLEAGMRLLLGSVVLGMKHGARVMKEQGYGSIVSNASVAAVLGGMGSPVYSACKAGIVGLTRNVAADLCQYGIRVNAIAPWGVATAMSARSLFGDPAMVDETTALNVQRSPLRGRAGSVEDCANAVAWLGSEEAGFITGQLVVVDGGLTCFKRPPSIDTPVR